MKKRVMWLIIVVMAISMVGIGIIQMIWFGTAIDQDKKNFDDKVTIALGIVKERLLEDAQNEKYAIEKFRSNKAMPGTELKTDLLSEYKFYDQLYKGRTQLEVQKLDFELKSMDMFINPGLLLEKIDKDKLDTYIKHEIEQQGIDLHFDYGIYSNEIESFIIMNGNYTAQISTGNSSPVKTGNELYNSPYKISLFNSSDTYAEDLIESTVPGYLKVYFPTKDKYLWSAVIPSLLMSILFTGLVLFCFGYVIYIVLRQKQISEMKTDFINNMTHEFKTPIATISLAADSIGSPMILGNDEKVMRFTNIIKQENQRMLGQVEKVLQMAMLDKKDFQLKLSDVDVHQLIRSATENMNLKILKRNGILRTDLKANNHIIQADSTHISNIIHNLLDNAEKYSSDKVSINVETIDKKDGIEISISDNGIGMSKDQVKNIFEKFYRAHTGNIHDVKGFGLGLSYVKAIVDAHSGTIKVKSEQGKGSTFSVYLPHKPRRDH